jgi:hypothetical protein
VLTAVEEKCVSPTCVSPEQPTAPPLNDKVAFSGGRQSRVAEEWRAQCSVQGGTTLLGENSDAVALRSGASGGLPVLQQLAAISDTEFLCSDPPREGSSQELTNNQLLNQQSNLKQKSRSTQNNNQSSSTGQPRPDRPSRFRDATPPATHPVAQSGLQSRPRRACALSTPTYRPPATPAKPRVDVRAHRKWNSSLINQETYRKKSFRKIQSATARIRIEQQHRGINQTALHTSEDPLSVCGVIRYMR